MFYHDYQMIWSQTTDSKFTSWISCDVWIWANNSVVECLTLGWGIVGLRLYGDTVFCTLKRHSILCSVLVQPRKCLVLTEKNVDWDIKHRLKRTKHGWKSFKPAKVCRKYNAKHCGFEWPFCLWLFSSKNSVWKTF